MDEFTRMEGAVRVKFGLLVYSTKWTAGFDTLVTTFSDDDGLTRIVWEVQREDLIGALAALTPLSVTCELAEQRMVDRGADE